MHHTRAHARQGPLHQRALAISKMLLGADLAFDRDALIATTCDTVPRWRQDHAYWPELPDRRAVTCWAALDHADVHSSGCRWFGAGTHRRQLLPHEPVAPGSPVLGTAFSVDRATAVPLQSGSATFHHGGTVHGTHGNQRRTLVAAFRPQSMVDYCRARGWDHAAQ